MSTVENMLIKGIRSFDPDNKHIITFFKPLTLIIGPNSIGKTTIIECLKLSCFGKLPPNACSGHSFVHDPKVAGETETKAQIKLASGLPPAKIWEIPALMGVSRAILENVIFMHQDEANWPLQDPSALRKKFDDIFSATRYTKALEISDRLFRQYHCHVTFPSYLTSLRIMEKWLF
ncbi:hypothetical protein COP2_004578 [Malus domestica]